MARQATGMRLELTPDELLTTTRSVRKRLDFSRPVERHLVEECIEIALQAPTGSNMQHWHWVVVESQEKKDALAALYRRHWVDYSAQPAPEPRAGDTRVERLAALIAGLRSLDEGSSLAAFEQLTLEDLGEAPLSVEQLVELQLEHEKLDRLLRSLSQREEQILRIRYGFHDGVARTLAQTGDHFGISRERVRQIEARALGKLRRAIELSEMDSTAGTSIH